MTETKKILLIGRSGRGKSALANVITGTNKFKESGSSTSETKKIQSEEFKDKEINYLIIDTPGIGDTKMSDNEVLDIIAEAVYLAREGLSQVLFTVKGRFDQSEMATYNLLRTIIFDDDITKHTTIVRARFVEFENSEKCKDDIKQMTDEEAKKKKNELVKKITDNKNNLEILSSDSEEYKELKVKIDKLKKELSTNLAEIVESCQERIIHVENPSISEPDDEDDEDDLRKRELSKGIRSKSRVKLLDHLGKTCQEDYKPEKLKELSNEIAEDMDKLLLSKKELEEEMKKIKAKVSTNTGSASTKLAKVEESENKLESLSEESSKTESVLKKEEELVGQEPTTESDNLAIGERIAQLEDKKSRLKKQIAEKEKIIRQKVLKHIFNNIDTISNELGGDVFLDSVVGKHDWKGIHSEFSNNKLVVEWLNQKFDYEQVQKWAIALKNNFDPKNDAGFCAWLRDDKKLTVESKELLSHISNIEQLRKDYAEQLEKEVGVLDSYKQKLSPEEEKQELSQAQQWLDEWYPKNGTCKRESEEGWGKKINDFGKTRNEIAKLYIWEKNLQGHLDLTDFVNLEELDCGMNELTSLNVNNLNKLEEVQCHRNHLTDLNALLADLNPDKLRKLNLHTHIKEFNKKFPKSDLTPFSIFVNLELLSISGQPFHGSLEPLKNLTKLEDLRINNTQLTIGLEYLPESLEKIECEGTKLEEELEPYNGGTIEKLQAWRLANENQRSQAQQWLDENYPKEERAEITYLDISKKNLEGHLDLKDFVNLESLDCSWNKLTSLNVNNLDSLQKFNCRNNLITSEDLYIDGLTSLEVFDCSVNYLNNLESLLSFLDPNKLKSLIISSNNFPNSDLNCFGRFINLENLTPGNHSLGFFGDNSPNKRNITILNRFYGSLEPLKNMSKLKLLGIANTNIDSGLEYLPDGVAVPCTSDEIPESKIKKIAEQLAPYDGNVGDWKKANQKLVEKAKNNNKLIEIQLPLKEIPSEYWDKVEVGDDWDKDYKLNREANLPIMENYPGSPWDKKFKTLGILEGYKKYTNEDEKFLKIRNSDSTGVPTPSIKDIKISDYFYFHPHEESGGYYTTARLTYFLREANKLFLKDGHGKVTSQKAFEFLQSIIESQEIKATVKLTQEELEKFKQENQQLQAQIEIPPKGNN